MCAKVMQEKYLKEKEKDNNQLLYFFLYFSMPDCRWNGEYIIVMDDVRIEPPYKPENCYGQKKDSLEHIRKMVSLKVSIITFLHFSWYNTMKV